MNKARERVAKIIYKRTCIGDLNKTELKQCLRLADKILTELGLRVKCPDCGGTGYTDRVAHGKHCGCLGGSPASCNNQVAVPCPSCTDGWIEYDVPKLVDDHKWLAEKHAFIVDKALTLARVVITAREEKEYWAVEATIDSFLKIFEKYKQALSKEG